MTSKELAPLKVSTLPALSAGAADMLEAIRENLGEGERIRVGDLDRIKIPSGGGLAFEVPTLDGADVAKTLQGVIIHHQKTRAYWSKPYDGSPETSIPDCTSPDSIQGYGDPGIECNLCPFSEYGSGKGDAQACTQRTQLFMLTEQSMLPMLISMPPTSLKPLRSFMFRLANAGIRYHGVVTRISLEKAKSGSGIDYSRAVFAAGERLDEAEQEKVQAFADQIRPFLVQQARDANAQRADALGHGGHPEAPGHGGYPDGTEPIEGV